MTARAERSVGLAALLPAAVAGLSWSPTFSATALALPVLLPLLAVLAVDQLTVRRTGAAVVRPVVGLLLGATILVLTFRVLDGAILGEVVRGIVGGWQRTLGSTFPARPEPAVMAFVPALALLAGVLGTEWARGGAGPLPTLLPGLAVLTLGQLVRAATGGQALAVATATAAGAAAVAVLLTQRHRPPRTTTGRRRPARVAPRLLTMVAVAALAAWTAVGLGIPGRATFSLAHDPDDTPPLHTPDPLDQIAVLLADKDNSAFTVRTGTPVGRWPLVVLDRFDGVSWTSSGRFLELGTELVPPPVDAATTPARAEVDDVRLEGPWLPSQPRLQTVEGTRPLVDPRTGTLVCADTGPVASYAISWDDVRIDVDGLTASTIDPDPVGAVQVDAIPAGIAKLARDAVPHAAPTLNTALALEKWMRNRYRTAVGDHLPTGHSTAQLLYVLDRSEVGTSEQFAPAYALMARSLGIPVRLVVGFRDDGSGTVHNRDVLAWPEIAVRGLGWVPLDPTPQASDTPPPGNDLAAATQAARDRLTDPGRLDPPPPVDPPTGAAPVAARPTGLPLWPLAVALLVALVAVPAAKHVRRRSRRRSPPRAAVVNAWRDTRDVLRDHGVAVAPGSTVRDLTGVAPVDPTDLAALARCVDQALWTGDDVDPALADEAWAAAAAIRRTLRDGPWQRRARAAFALASLR